MEFKILTVKKFNKYYYDGVISYNNVNFYFAMPRPLHKFRVEIFLWILKDKRIKIKFRGGII